MTNPTAPGPDAALRNQLIALLDFGEAHQTLDDALHDLPAHLRGVVPDNLPYSIWQLVDHIRIAQWDILEFSRDPAHQSPAWPEGYWPKDAAPPTDDAWQAALDQITHDRAEFSCLLADPEQDLFKPFPHGNGQTLLREALLIADHAAYHIGQIVLIRRLLGTWE